jgi:type IV secretory pathway TrbD component
MTFIEEILIQWHGLIAGYHQWLEMSHGLAFWRSCGGILVKENMDKPRVFLGFRRNISSHLYIR